MHGVENFLSNLTYTDTIVNDLLQLKFRNGANDLARFLVNTVIGVGGLFDPASGRAPSVHGPRPLQPEPPGP